MFFEVNHDMCMEDGKKLANMKTRSTDHDFKIISKIYHTPYFKILVNYDTPIYCSLGRNVKQNLYMSRRIILAKVTKTESKEILIKR